MNRQEIDQAALDLYRDPSRRQYLRDALEELRPAVSWGQWLTESGTLSRLAECMVICRLRGEMSPLSALTDPDMNKAHYAWRAAVGSDIEAKAMCDERYSALCAAFGVPPVMIEVGHYDDTGPAGFNVGDLVEAIPPHVLASGSGRYQFAVIVSVHPFVAISEEGDMLWRATIRPENVRVTGRASSRSLANATRRWNSEQQTTMQDMVRWSAPSVPLALAVLMEAVTLMGIPGTGMTAADLPGLLAHHHSWGREVRQHAPSATAYRIRLADGQWTERRI